MKLGRPFLISVALLAAIAASAADAETFRLESFSDVAAARLAAADSLPIPPDSLPPSVIQVGISPPKPCGVAEVAMVFSACTCNVQFREVGRDEDGIVLHVEIRPEIVCVDCGLDSLFVPLGTLLPGNHTAGYKIEADIVFEDGTVQHATRRGFVSFEVARECGPQPGIQFIERIAIGGLTPCVGCPPIVCAGDSIRVRLAGYLPDTCHRFEGVELIPPPYGSPLPYPPIVRVLIGTNSCLGMPCALVITPWQAEVVLPPLPERDYILMAEAAVLDHCTGSIQIAQREERPFIVGEPCGLPTDCFLMRWVDETGEADGCDATVGEGEPAVVRMALSSGVAVAGLQGKLRFFEQRLQILDIERIGPASALALEWSKTDEGAQFVLVATGGALIPASREAQPILRITCGPRPGIPIPEISFLNAFELVAADSAGGGIRGCPEIYQRIVTGARICREVPCDVNGDGAADVRDLVILVNCIQQPDLCPHPERARVDCDGSGEVNLDDVLCCARRILHHDLPDSIPARNEPSVAVVLGVPVRTGDGYDISVTLRGADRIGAARLALDYPRDRFRVDRVDFPDAGADWLAMHEVDDRGVLLGWIGLGQPATPSEVNAIVHLSHIVGSGDGGEVRVREVDLAGRDGVPLVDPAGDISMPLSPRLVLALSSPRPNPFRGLTEFSLTANEDSDVDIAVFDLAGREVTSIYRGAVTAGQRAFQWNGSANGVRLRSGLYFLRAQSGSAVAMQRVVILGGEGYRVPLE